MRAGLALGQAGVEDEEAREAVVDLEVGEDPGRFVGHLGGNHGAAVRGQAGEDGFGADLLGRAQFDMGGDDQLAGDAGYPLRMHGIEGGGVRVQFFAIGQRAEEGVAGKFGVQLPAHAEGAGVDHQVRIGAFDGVARMALAQLVQIARGRPTPFRRCA